MKTDRPPPRPVRSSPSTALCENPTAGESIAICKKSFAVEIGLRTANKNGPFPFPKDESRL